MIFLFFVLFCFFHDVPIDQFVCLLCSHVRLGLFVWFFFLGGGGFMTYLSINLFALTFWFFRGFFFGFFSVFCVFFS